LSGTGADGLLAVRICQVNTHRSPATSRRRERAQRGGVRRALAAGAALLAAGAALAGCGGDAPASAGSAERNGVRVEAVFEAAPGGDGAVRVTFTPQQQGFHLYSSQLPARGVDGVGRPTKVEVGGALATTGPVTADRDVIQLQVPGVSRPMPVYPDGAVTLRLPVHRASSGGAASAVVGYAACSAQTCLPPVAGLRIPLALP
jgi:hypothetical protein